MEELIKQFLSGYGYGSGSGYGYGYGSGDGDGDGSGYGSGSGDGSGYGSGDGDGDGSGYGIKLITYNGKKVYYIDGIPCYFIAIKKNQPFAKIAVINTIDLSICPQFVFKFDSCFAHGLNLKDAKREAENKYYSQLDVKERIAAFNDSFKRGIQYDAKLFYDWHTTLTGSCQPGKDLFITQRSIDLKSSMTVDEFISLTKDSYGGDIIQQLMRSNAIT